MVGNIDTDKLKFIDLSQDEVENIDGGNPFTDLCHAIGKGFAYFIQGLANAGCGYSGCYYK